MRARAACRQVRTADSAPRATVADPAAVDRARAAIIHGAMTHVTWHHAFRLRWYASRNATSLVLKLRRCQNLPTDASRQQRRRGLDTAACGGRSGQPCWPQAPPALPIGHAEGNGARAYASMLRPA
ncbi:hypothetical protein XAC2852_580020 [Xanthomonas citri pv. citri]|uniref:Uncharacterized protein n=1 Tax=Xanthomonas citri pv. citri TaxID=611301 RepID=A0A0U5FK72_XANCI|nr:hypothetical protein XAC2852_580020 [Xanthomonas citri pv. citri]CEE88160.1 hypothetical protein XAC3218_730020 [Xanthomonas citri pv. citri]CEG17359.1 hypothetical protein XAC3562_620020 [Xanthomonas citri pv. citri]CEH55863.1 hypothetical protein XACLG97_6770007 [Xanthomonas citri pv. citri]CEH79010.1 hypothetical protein XACS582_8340002 [Xanthomonas citri pv. citri]